MEFGPPRGMRDFYPDEMARRNTLFGIWRRAAGLHGFEEYDAPVVETEELLVRKGGEEIVRQIYRFEDKSGRKLALRPEMTPSLARMILARQNALSYPVKWFSIPQCFRYERMTRGRKREHFQWNLDIIGEENACAEAEVLSTAVTALTLAGLKAGEFHVHVGSRALLGDLFEASGIPTGHFEAVCLALDKRDKLPPDETAGLLETEGLSKDQIGKVFGLLEIDDLDGAATYLGKPTRALENLRELFAVMNEYGKGAFMKFDISIVRGLTYYTDIVFEAFDAGKKLRAIFGGGRYDNLVSDLGGSPVPCVGLGFGDVVVLELLDSLNRALPEGAGPDVHIGFLTEEERSMALRGAGTLRNAGLSVNLDLKAQKAKRVFARAARERARFAIFLGPREREEGIYAVKDLASGNQLEVKPSDLASACAGT